MSADRLAEALLSTDPLAAVTALRASLSGDLLAVADAAIARLSLRVPVAESPEAVLLLAISAHPGSSLAALAERTGLADVRTAATSLLADGLVEDRRFERTDCWARTLRGGQAVRVLTA